MNNTEDEGVLDLFDESHHTGSQLGSHISGTNRLQPPAPVINKNFQQTTTSHADFERDHEDLEDASSYEEYDSPVEEEGGGKADGSNSDSDDVGSFYQPTIVAKKEKASAPTKTKKKKKKKKKTKALNAMPELMSSPDQKNYTSNSGGALKGMDQQNLGGVPTYPHSGTAAGTGAGVI